jgi:O-antigen/teichoic acid export membrane protein
LQEDFDVLSIAEGEDVVSGLQLARGFEDLTVCMLLRRLRGHKVYGNVLKLGGGTALGQGIVIAVTPIITRLYSPEQMGLFGIFLAFVGLASVGGMRYEIAIVSTADKEEADHLLTASLGITVITSLLGGVILYWMISQNLASYGRLPGWSAIAASLILFVTSAFMSVRYWLVRSAEFVQISKMLVAQGVGRAAIMVGIGLFHAGWVGLLMGELVGRSFGIWSLMRKAWPAVKATLNIDKLSYYWSLLKRYRQYPIFVLPSSIIEAAYALLPLPLISWLFGSAASGQFLLSQRLCGLPGGLITASMADVFHSHFAETFRDNRKEASTILWSLTRRLAFMAVIIYVPLAIVSPFLFGKVFGEQWTETGWLVTAYTPLSMAGLVVSPLSRVLLVAGHSELKLAMDSVRSVIPVVSFYVLHSMGYGLLACVTLFSLLGVCAYGLYFVFIVYSCRGVS